MKVAALEFDLVANVARLQKDMEQARRVVDTAVSDVSRMVGRINTALGTIGVGLSLTALTAWAKHLLDGVDALNDIKDATGATIEKISALEQVIKRNGGATQTAFDILVKFNKTLQEVKPDSGPAQILKSLGLSAQELRRLDPADALHKTAQAFARYADDGNKARNVQELFGKSIKEAGPFLKDLAEKTTLVGTVTTKQAEEIERFNKILYKLKTDSEESARQGIIALVRSLDELGKTVERNKGAFYALAGMIAAPAAAGGLASIAPMIGKISTAIGALGAVIAANPLVAVLLGLTAATGAAIGYARGNADSDQGLAEQISALERLNETSRRLLKNAQDAGRQAGAASIQATIAQREAQIIALRSRRVLTATAGADADGSYATAEAARLARAGGDAPSMKAPVDMAAVKALLDARNALAKAKAEQFQQIEQNSLEQFVQDNELAFKAGSIDVESYYARKAQLQLQDIDIKERALIEELKIAQKSVEQQSKEDEKVKAQAKVVEITTKLIALGKERMKVEGPDEAALRAWERLNKAMSDFDQDAARVNGDLYAQEKALRESNEEARIRAKYANDINGDYRTELDLIQLRLEREKKVLEVKLMQSTLSEKEKDNLRQLLADDAALKTAEASQREWRKTFDYIRDGLTDALMRGFESGKGFARNFRDTLKNMFQTLVLRPIIQAVLAPISGTLTSIGQNIGSAITGGGGTGLLGLLSSGSSLIRGGSSLLSMLSGGVATTGAGLLGGAVGSIGGAAAGNAALVGALTADAASATAAATAVAQAAGTTAVGAGAGGTIGAALGAIPGIGWAALAALAAAAIFGGKGGGPKQDGQFGAYGGMNTLTGQIQSGQYAQNSLAGTVRPVVESLQKQYDDLVAAFGGTGGIKFGLGISTDPKGKSPTFLEGYGQDAAGNMLFANLNKNVGRSQEDLTQAMQVAAADMLIGALKRSKLADGIQQVFDSVADDASLQEKLAAIERANGILTERKALEERLFQLTATDLQKLTHPREAARAAVNESNRALLERIYAEEDAKAAEQVRAQKLQVLQQALLEQVSTAEADLREAYGRESGALQELITRHRDYAAAIRKERDALLVGDQSPLSTREQASVAMLQYQAGLAKAMGGDAQAQADFPNVARQLLSVNQMVAGSAEEQARLFIKIREDMRLLANTSDAQADVAQLQLNALTAQVSTLITINTSVLSVKDAIAALQGAQSAAAAAGAAQQQSGKTLAMAAYAARGVNSPDAEGLAFWTAALGSGALSIADFNASFDYVRANSHATGLYQVPHDDYPARLHRDEMVLTAGQAARVRHGSSADDAMVAAIEKLDTRLSRIEVNTGSTARASERSRDVLEGASSGQLKFNTKETA